ncbi:TonB family protein [Xanthomonas vasicola]|uniref:Energy transducer TonB n=3 Tax=Xanthomonas vasicola TaxID=56459 RepID=A0A836P4Z3_XANVA|nr:TonB family protein [Xanthomonas vasicola]KFA24166.1 energy transducer TonB [Xanthomonas vasicola pv. vasculorum NCPPB 1326]KFA33934.1 energy transducer TonB [Xanthomonas vasicola pv. vasculorum NCPPB 206]MBV6746813.1 TonB family protein [Xanthomonas vasicola pv. vasculorum NCPPB 890]MBV6892189.1 TonB family protein [Xanthomonas vasicola pv. vasculorum]MDO6947928.1 TonB family protein [Xanthomonas vasicola]
MHLDLPLLLRVTVYSSAALLTCMLLRRALRAWLGATAAYAIWAAVPLAMLAAVMPRPPIVTALPKMPALVAMPLNLQGSEHAWSGEVLTVWLVGAAAMAVALWWRQRRFVRSLGVLHALDGGLWAATHDVGLPVSLGLWRRRIVLPMDFDTRYTAAERSLVLAHERLHLRRGDLYANLLAALLLCIGWCNPLMHLAWRAFRLDQELACDADVLTRYPGKRRSYATAMLKTQCGADWMPTACHWNAPHALTQRVAALLGPAVDVPRARWNLCMVVGLAVMVGGACWAFQPAQLQGRRVPGNALDFSTMQPPKYPPDAVAAGLAGFVELQIAVSPTGTPDHIAIVRSTPAGVFDQTVLDAARRWRFTPALEDGRAVASELRVPVRFELDPPDTASAITTLSADADAAGLQRTAAQSERVARCASAKCAPRGMLQ